MYKIKDRMTTPIKVLKEEKTNVNGRVGISHKESSDELIWCIWKSYGGTESVIDGLSVYKDTATIECRFTPNINQNDIIENLITNTKYKIITVPDDINQLHQFLRFKVERLTP